MKISIKFATAAAVSVLMASAALADSNITSFHQEGDNNLVTADQSGLLQKAKLSQLGDSNTLTLNQSGERHVAGLKDYNAADPNANSYMLQDGDNNMLVIDQSGLGHYSGNTLIYGGGNKLRQLGDNNSAEITQVSSGSGGAIIYNVLQEAIDGQVGASNILTVDQRGAVNGAYDSVDYPGDPIGGSNYNYAKAIIGSISQIHDGGDPNILDITQSGSLASRTNEISTVWQEGSGNIGMIVQTDGFGNNIGSVNQYGDGNSVSVSQSGFNNVLTSLSQNNEGSGDVGNTATLSFTGIGNGSGTFGSEAGLVANVSLSSVTQLGDENSLMYNVTGDDNQFGFYQDGDNNSIEGTVDGNNNQAAISQDGSDNNAPFTQIGNNNVVAVSQ